MPSSDSDSDLSGLSGILRERDGPTAEDLAEKVAKKVADEVEPDQTDVLPKKYPRKEDVVSDSDMSSLEDNTDGATPAATLTMERPSATKRQRSRKPTAKGGHRQRKSAAARGPRPRVSAASGGNRPRKSAGSPCPTRKQKSEKVEDVPIGDPPMDWQVVEAMTPKLAAVEKAALAGYAVARAAGNRSFSKADWEGDHYVCNLNSRYQRRPFTELEEQLGRKSEAHRGWVIKEDRILTFNDVGWEAAKLLYKNYKRAKKLSEEIESSEDAEAEEEEGPATPEEAVAAAKEAEVPVLRESDEETEEESEESDDDALRICRRRRVGGPAS